MEPCSTNLSLPRFALISTRIVASCGGNRNSESVSRVTAVKAGRLNVTLTNYRNTDALDGVLGARRNILLCPRCVPGLLEILDFSAHWTVMHLFSVPHPCVAA